jgi:dTMP kinase
MPYGKFIIIEGPDGSGKSEQFKRLTARVQEERRFATAPLHMTHFPQYEEPSSYFVREYLAGNYGTLEDVGPYEAALFYAMDRYDASVKRLLPWLAAGEAIILDRFVGSNMGHQGSKIVAHDERMKFFKWLYEIEYGILKIPKPDLNIILHIPASIALELRRKRAEAEATTRKDIHEEDLSHLEKTEKIYLQIAELFPDDFTVIECVENGRLLSIDEVHEKVWAIAQRVLGL